MAMWEKNFPGRGWGRCKFLLKTEFEIHENASMSSSNDVKHPLQKKAKILVKIEVSGNAQKHMILKRNVILDKIRVYSISLYSQIWEVLKSLRYINLSTQILINHCSKYQTPLGKMQIKQRDCILVTKEKRKGRKQ